MFYVSGCIPDSCKTARVVQQPQQSDFKMKLYYITQSPTLQLPAAAAPDEAAASASVVSILTPIMNTMDQLKTLHTTSTCAYNAHTHTYTHIIHTQT